jgi:hypothetical protein
MRVSFHCPLSFILTLLSLSTTILSATFNPSLVCSSNGGKLPTPTYGGAGILFTACTELLINAPLSKIYNTIIDFQRYGAWNSFVPAVSLPPGVVTPGGVYVGMKMGFTSTGLIPGVNTSSTEVVTVLSPPGSPQLTSNPTPGAQHGQQAIAAWRSDDILNGTLLPAEHPNLLTDFGNGSVRYVSYETYYIPGAVALLGLKANLQKEFEQQGLDLKRYVEAM